MPTGNSKRGFILPLAVMLVVILSISGTAFMHHDYLERRMASNNLDNQGAFYLGNAGIERARETFKIPEPDQTWTSVFQPPYYDGPINPGPDYPVDPAPVFCPLAPNSCLCGPNAASGCVIPSFGALVSAGIPFDALFAAGQYEVRAFNNEPSLTDTDQILIFRALGTIRGERKLLEATVLATSAGNLITCANPPCPSKDCDLLPGGPVCDPMPGREPGVGPIPEPDFPLTDSQNYYRIDTTLNPAQQAAKRDANFRDDDNPANPLLSVYDDIVGNVAFGPPDALDETYYFVDGNVALQNVTASNVVIFATGQIEVGTKVTLTNAVLVSVGGINFNGGGGPDVGAIKAPVAPFLHYPAIFSGGDVTKSSGSFEIFGNIYAEGDVNLQALEIEGATFSKGPNGVIVQSASDTYTDDDNLRYYSLMKGFVYGAGGQTNTMIPGSWREIQ